MTQDTPGAAPLSPEEKRQMLARLLSRKAAAPRTFPASFAQQRLWFLHHLEPESAAYNVPATRVLDGRLDVDALHRAAAELVRRHEALRTRFALAAGEPVQVVDPAVPVTMDVEDMPGGGEDERLGEFDRRVKSLVNEPFDLERGPLFRMRLLRLAPERHVFVLVVHHTVTDGWSFERLQAEMEVLYEAFAAGQPSPLPDPPLQYADFAIWQRGHLQGAELARQLEFWRGVLDGAPPLLELPTDRPRTATLGSEGAACYCEMGGGVAAAVRELSRREGATGFMTMLAVYAVLLQRWSGQDDLVVGTPILGRPRSELEGVVGYFANTLAVRIRLDGDPTFREMVRRVREVMLGAQAHQDLPFDKLVEELKVERSLEHAPVYQVMLAHNSARKAPPPGVDAEAHDPESADGETGDAGPSAISFRNTLPPSGTAVSDLKLTANEGLDEYLVRIDYRTDLFDAASAERMVEQFERLVIGATEDPDRRISTLDILSDEEREQVLRGWNDTGRGYPPTCIHRLFEAQAAKTPDAVALVQAAEALTYSELNARANQFAHHLQSLGVGPESLVGVCMERRPEMIVALLAVLKAGGAYVPVDPSYPADRIAYMLEDSRAAVVLTQSSVAAHLPSTEAVVVSVDADWGKFSHLPNDNLSVDVRPENAAYAIYTSGSTGKPKGVQIEHRSTSVLLHWLREAVTDEERAAALGSTSISFDVSVAEIFGTLCWGGKLILVENALSLAELSVDAGVRLATMVPSAAAELLRMGAIPSTVRTFKLGGEALPNALAQGLYELGHVDRVLNLYGPTEDTTYSTWSEVERGGAKVYVGRPVANTRAYIVDQMLQPVPVAVQGELYLAGDGLARGYLNRPALTAERFVPDPFSGQPGARMYRVGDRVRWTEGGVLEYLGRLDHQVKIRGFRVETGEVEAALASHPSVAAAAVIAREDTPGDTRLVGYFATADGAAPPDVAELRAHLKASLPDHMVPSAFVAMDALPLTPNGKVDRRALPAPEHASREDSYVAPRTPAEQSLADIWAELLRVPRVGATDHFFELGGHSLIATQLMSRIRTALGVELPLRAVFEAPTVAEMALRVDAAAQAGVPEGPAAPRLARVSRDARRAAAPAAEGD